MNNKILHTIKQLTKFSTSYKKATLMKQPPIVTATFLEKSSAIDEVPLQEILALAKKLIQVPSFSGDIEKAVEILTLTKEQLTDFTFTPFVSNSFPSILYNNGKDPKHFKIILNAHLDVVPGVESQFRPYEEDGKLYGRGSYDMKAAAAVMIILFNEIADQVTYPLGLQLVTEEEFAESNGTEHQIANGIRSEFAIIGECGSNLRLLNETKGILTVKIITQGHSAHGAYLWRGKNAILKMYDIINTLHKHFPVPDTDTDETTINVAKIATTNNVPNKVPDNCTALLDIRFNKKDRATILSRIKSLLPEDVTLQVDQNRNPHFTDPDNVYIKQLKIIGKEITGKELAIEKTHGGADTTYFSNVGCDAIEFGPIGHGQHHDEEWVDIKSLGVYYQILKKFLLSVK